jgi:hypothetical protein
VLRAANVKYAARRAHSLGSHSRFAIWTKHNALGQLGGHSLLRLLLLSCLYRSWRHVSTSDWLHCGVTCCTLHVAMMISKLAD